MRAPHELEARHGLEHVVRDLQRVVRAAVLQQHAELVAAEARHHVGQPHPRLQHLAELAQQLVAGHVAAGVVDHLEAVEVHEQHGVGRAGGVRQLERVLQPRLELAAVLQAGERIVARVVGQLLGEGVGRRDVGQRALVEQHAVVGVAHRARVLQHHELAAVLALQQQLGVAHLAVLGHRLHPLVAVVGLGVDVARHVDREQLVLAVVAEHAHQRRVGRHELAVHGGLEHAGGDVLEQLAVALLGGLERLERVGALGRVAQHLVHQLRRDLTLGEEVERAALHDLLAEVLVLLGDQHDHRDGGGLRLQAQEGGGAEAVRQVEVQQDRVHPPAAHGREGVGQGADGLHTVRLAADGVECRADGRVVVGLGADEQDVGMAHLPPSIGPAAGRKCETRIGRSRPTVRQFTTFRTAASRRNPPA